MRNWRGLGEEVVRGNEENGKNRKNGEDKGSGVVWLRADNSRVPESEWPPNPVYPGRAAGGIKDILRERGFLGEDARGEGEGGKVEGRGEVLFY